MNRIRFSHHYPKIWGQRAARLLLVAKVDRHELDEDFVEYDTTYHDAAAAGGKGHFPLRPGAYLLLVFLGDKRVPFTTVRPWSPEKADYYTVRLGSMFEIEVAEPAEDLTGAGDGRA